MIFLKKLLTQREVKILSPKKGSVKRIMKESNSINHFGVSKLFRHKDLIY